MPYKIEAEHDVCEGFANCMMKAPDLFDLDDDDAVVVLRDEVADEEHAHADEAVRSCPVKALKLEAQ